VVSYSVLANNTLEKRAGTATIAGKSFTVFQDGLPDDLAPVVSITKPAGSGPFSDATGAIDVAGTVTDNGTVTLVTWATDRGASGVAVGTNNWSITQLPLSVGLNTITITAQDAAGNIGRRSIVVRSPPAAVVTTTVANLVLTGSLNSNVTCAGAFVSRALAAGVILTSAA